MGGGGGGGHTGRQALTGGAGRLVSDKEYIITYSAELVEKSSDQHTQRAVQHRL